MNYEAFRTKCKEKGYSMSRLVTELGLSKGNVTKWKNGGNPSIDTLIKISHVLECSVGYLLGTEDEIQNLKPLTIYSKMLTVKIRSGASLSTVKNILNVFDGMGAYEKDVILSIQSEANTWLKASTTTSDVFLSPFEDCIVEHIDADSETVQIWLLTDDVTGELIKKLDVENGIIVG